MSTFETKLARFQEEQEQKRNKMIRPMRTEALRKLRELLAKTTDPEMIVKICNTIAKLSAQQRKARRPRRDKPIKKKEPTVEDMVLVMEKQRDGMPLTEDEKQIAAMEKRHNSDAQKVG